MRRYRSMRKIITKNKVIFLSSVIMIIIGMAFIKLGIESSKENATSIYEIQRNSDYEVVLKPNDFYMTESIPSGRYYASESINNFTINFKYDFKANENAKLNYNYTVTAELVGKANTNENQSKEIWNRIFNLIENNETQENMNEFSINQEAVINYEEYNELARSFEKTYGINIDTVLKVRLNIYLNADYSDANVKMQKLEDYIELDIPINSTVTNATENYEKNNFSDIFIENNETNINKIVIFIIGVMFIISAILMIFIIIRKKLKERTPEDRYRNNVNKILSFYKELIVSVTNEPNIANLEVMNVPFLDDIIDVAEQNKVNIIHYEVEPNAKSLLYAVVDKYVYVYVITANDIR